jgi:hypothetical protein
MAIGWATNGSGVGVPVGTRIVTSLCRLDRLWRSPSLLYNGYWGLSPGVKQPGPEVDHSLPTSAEVKKTRVYVHMCITPYVFMA